MDIPEADKAILVLQGHCNECFAKKGYHWSFCSKVDEHYSITIMRTGLEREAEIEHAENYARCVLRVGGVP